MTVREMPSFLNSYVQENMALLPMTEEQTLQ